MLLTFCMGSADYTFCRNGLFKAIAKSCLLIATLWSDSFRNKVIKGTPLVLHSVHKEYWVLQSPP